MRSTLVVLGGLLVACGPVQPVDSNQSQNQRNQAVCPEGGRRCLGSMVQTCLGGAWVDQRECVAPTGVCSETLGCVACQPGGAVCDGLTVRSCRADGTPGGVLEECDPEAGESCEGGACVSPCRVAEQQNSYIGCDYWALPAANPGLSQAFDTNFGVVVHNDRSEASRVVIERGGQVVAAETVAPGALHTFELPLDTGLKLSYLEDLESRQVAAAAYHLTSTLPVTVYQFNPLDFENPVR